MTTQPIYSLTDTWNAGGTVFTAIGMNVTDTASAAGSLLLDLQVGGTSRFSVRKDGAVKIGGVFLGPWYGGSDVFSFQTSTGVNSVGIRPGVDLSLASNMKISWTPNTDLSGPTDLTLVRDAANTLAQRNGVDAQSFRLYET
jgi:hypothetical protein